VLLRENTILSEEHTELLTGLYGEFAETQGVGRMEEGNQAELQWSAVNLRQAARGEICNRLYMKVEVGDVREGVERSKTVSMTLLEFRVFAEEVGRAASLLA
jgi:hypothetical protein